MQPNFREAGTGDTGDIVRLIALVAAENQWIRTELPFDQAERERRMVTAMQAGNMVSFVVETDAGIVGELTLLFREERAALAMVVTAPYRRQGIGRALMSLAIAKVRERAVPRIELAVYSHNRAAIALYRSLGFVDSGPAVAEERSDGQRWEAIPMTKEIAKRVIPSGVEGRPQ
jgi:ribosomal protein S18 acetylase RimI-like enzyme